MPLMRNTLSWTSFLGMKAISIDLALVLTQGAVDEAFSVHDSGDIESATLALAGHLGTRM